MNKSLLRMLVLLPIGLVLLALTGSCKDNDNNWDSYKEWREANTDFYNEQKFAIEPDGQARYQTLTPQWDNTASILVRWLNDRAKTADNLSPLLTSTVAVKYRGGFYTGVGFDSSYLATDSLFVTRPGDVISGWTIALLNMKVGDKTQIVVPYALGYGTSGSGTSIPPFSTLVFDIELVDILDYEKRP
ncbi:MAG: FKBP-type peptidyl-prolyl cis-trans isomerase [Duncaniella sp.]|nr:FKBP-type peptidyl-prolyl cis-trans isomerase [Duncaniella sp.]